MKKKLTLTIEEDVIRDLKIYVLNHGSNNVSKLIEELATEFLNKEGEKEMKNEWVEKNYTVVAAEHDYDLKKFEVYQEDELIGTIYPDDLQQQEQIINDLNNHVNVDGWETNDGEGGEIELIRYLIETVNTKEEKAGNGIPTVMFEAYNYQDMKSMYDNMIWDNGTTLLLGKQDKEEYELLEKKSN